MGEDRRIAIAGRRAQVLEETARNIGGDVLCCPCDVTDEKAVRNMVKEIIARFERIDILVLAAGVLPSRTDITATELEIFNDTMAASVTGDTTTWRLGLSSPFSFTAVTA